MANNSATAFLKVRPASTAGRTVSIQSAGMDSTRFLPATMKVSEHSG